ncbi:L,D-transpeptidase family protein [Streptomyces sp. NPDC046931]|uniref:L,D-transpeptidase n=1 Tax=Streptomyces sp. NPDC046931 TaxID=3154806 RepID=UPI0033DBEDD2
MTKRSRVRRGRSRLAALAAMVGSLIVTGAPGASAAGTPEVRLRGDEGTVMCRLSTGPYQRQVEKFLELPQDGKQSAEDCAAIQSMQSAYGISPADGYAGLVSHRAAALDWAMRNPASLTGCAGRSRLVVCVDQTRQLVWVQRSGEIVFGPVPARTGMPGHRTRNGSYKIYKRVEKFWSSLYNAPMPFSQFFDRGEALHASHRPIFEEPGSHGCVNLRYEDARTLWPMLRVGDGVVVFGKREGK